MRSATNLPHHDGTGIWRDLGLWSFAAAVVVGLHGAALALHLRDRPIPVAEGGPPPAIMIELAPLPEATDTDSTELSTDQEDAEAQTAADETAPSEPEPEPLPEEILPEEPPEPEEPLLEEAPQEAEVTLPMQISLRPMPRPERPQPTKPARETPREPPKPKAQEAAAPSEAATKARNADAEKAERDAAAQPAAGTGRAISPARWQARLMAHLERHKPRSRGERGTAYVTFTIDAAGNVLSAGLARSSGNGEIDAAAVAVVRRASPVPAPPPDAKRTMTVAIKFDRR